MSSLTEERARGRTEHPVRNGLVAAAVLFAACSLSLGFLAARARENQVAAERAALLRSAQLVARQIDGELLKTIRLPEQEATSEYARAIEPMRRAIRSSNDFAYVYTVVRDGEQVRFVLDATPRGDADSDGREDHSRVGDPYLEAPAQM